MRLNPRVNMGFIGGFVFEQFGIGFLSKGEDNRLVRNLDDLSSCTVFFATLEMSCISPPITASLLPAPPPLVSDSTRCDATCGADGGSISIVERIGTIDALWDLL